MLSRGEEEEGGGIYFGMKMGTGKDTRGVGTRDVPQSPFTGAAFTVATREKESRALRAERGEKKSEGEKERDTAGSYVCMESSKVGPRKAARVQTARNERDHLFFSVFLFSPLAAHPPHRCFASRGRTRRFLPL